MSEEEHIEKDEQYVEELLDHHEDLDTDDRQDICLNCGQELVDPSYIYCPICGQDTQDKLTLRNLFQNTIANYFSFDSRIKRSFLPLLFKPGYLPKAFIGGKRTKYIHPAQFYLFCSVIFFFFFALATRGQENGVINIDENGNKITLGEFIDSLETDLTSDNIPEFDNELEDDSANSDDLPQNPDDIKTILGNTMDSILINPPEDMSRDDSISFNNLKFAWKDVDSLLEAGTPYPVILDSLKVPDKPVVRMVSKRILKIIDTKGEGIGKSILDKFPLALFFLLPIFAFILKLLYIRRKQPYANHLVFTFYFFTFLVVVGTLMAICALLIPEFIEIAIAPFAIVTFIYCFLAMYFYYKQGIIKTFIKLNILFFLYNLIALPLAFALVMVISFLTF